MLGGSTHSINLDTKSQPGFNLGAIFDFPFSKAWSFQTGLTYNSFTIDSNWEVIQHVVNQDMSFDGGSLSNFTFLELPVSLSTGISLSENSQIKFNSGVYFSIFTGGSSLYRSTKADNVILPTYSNPVGGGFLIGTGLEINHLYLGVEGNINIPDGYKSNYVLKTKLGVRF